MSKSISCKGCGAQVVIPDGQKSAKCEYCGLINSLPEQEEKQSSRGRNTEQMDADSLIRRAYILLEEGNFRHAAALVEQALNLEPENAFAYIAQLMAALGARQESELANNSDPLTGYSGYANALRFGSEEQKERLEGYNRQILDRLDEEREAWQRRIAYEAEQKRIRTKRTLKIWAIIGIVIAVFLITSLIGSLYMGPNRKYQQAIAYSTEEDYNSAISLYAEITDFKDTKKQLNIIGQQAYEKDNLAAAAKAWRLAGNTAKMQIFKNLLSVGGGHIVGVQPDGTVLAAGDNESGECDVSGWTDITAVSAGADFTVGLKKDGTVVATGGNKWGQCNVSDWTNIIQIDTGNYYTLGLKSDGTVLAAGDNSDGRCDVSGWSDIVYIAAANYLSVGVKSDGTVVAVGDNEYGQCNVTEWSDIVAVAAAGDHTVGLKSDGTLVAAGSNRYGQCDVAKATDMVMIDAAQGFTVAIKNNGYIGRAGDPPVYSFSYDQNMLTASADYEYAYGIKEDGSVYIDDIISIWTGDWNLFSVQSGL